MDETATTLTPAITSPNKDKPTTTNTNQMDTEIVGASSSETTKVTRAAQPTTLTTSSKTLKRCLSVPIIRNVPTAATTFSSRSITTRSAAAAATALKNELVAHAVSSITTKANLLETPKKDQQAQAVNSSGGGANNAAPAFLSSAHIGIPRSNPSSREVSPAPMFNIFAPRARRYSASYSPMGNAGVCAGGAALSGNGATLCLTPRVSQLRQEECVDMNSREVNHEREIHTAMQMSQSWEDLTLVTENWSCKSDEFSNPLQVVLPTTTGSSGCSSPSPTSTRAGLRLPYGLSPSPTRRTFATRRSMSPIAMRPSQLGAVKRKFEMEEGNNGAQGNWNVYSPPPLKKIFTESRGSSPSSVCPSPDSGTYDGRMTPKLFISKLCTSNANNSTISSYSSASSSSSSSNSASGGSEPMICGSSIDEGISGSESEEKLTQGLLARTHGGQLLQSSSADMQDMDEKSETSSIGGCSSISIESSSWDSNVARTPANFLSQLATSPSTTDDQLSFVTSSSSTATTALPNLSHKNFYINKPVGVSGTKKYIVNHENMPNSSNISCSEPSTPDVMTGDISSSTTAAAVDRLANTVIAANVV